MCSSDLNDTIAEFARSKIRDIVKDPETADLLCPDNVFGCKRLCVDTGYFAAYNQPHVRLVDVSEKPIERFTKKGIFANDIEYEFDSVVCATGFAAMTGSFDKIQITGRGGDRKSTRLNSSHKPTSYAVFCLKKKN